MKYLYVNRYKPSTSCLPQVGEISDLLAKYYGSYSAWQNGVQNRTTLCRIVPKALIDFCDTENITEAFW